MSFYFPNVDPVYLYKRKGDEDDPYIPLKQELQIKYGRITLKEIPDFKEKVSIENRDGNELSEIGSEEPKDPKKNEYIVDYSTGIIYFNSSNEEDKVKINYLGTGYVNIGSDRIIIDTSDTNNEEMSLQGILDSQGKIYEKIDDAHHTADKVKEDVQKTKEIVEGEGAVKNKTFREFKEEAEKEFNKFEDYKKKTHYLEEIEDSFDYTELEPNYLMHLGGIRNAVNQSIAIDDKTNQMYITQSDSQSPEGFYISRLSPSGSYIDSMWIQEGGHGTSIGLDRSDGVLKVWIYHRWRYKLILVEYEGNKILTPSEADGYTDHRPRSIAENDTYFTPVYDPYYDQLCFRTGDGIVEIRDKRDVINKIDKIKHTVHTDKSENSTTGERSMQGCVVYGTDVYWQSGGSDLDESMKIQKYDAKKDEKVADIEVKDMVAEEGNMMFKDDFKEPEGITFYKNPKTGKKTLLFVITTGGSHKRYHILYGYNQRGAGEHWVNMRTSGAQTYALTRGDGRAHRPSDNVTSLNDIVQTGQYYFESKDAKRISGFPFPVRSNGWFLEVTAQSPVFHGIQILRRNTRSLQLLEFKRVFVLNKKTLKYEFGTWTSTLVGSEYAELLNPDIWGGSLTAVTMGGEYYLTAPQLNRFNDSPSQRYKNMGYRMFVTNTDASNRVMQRLECNSSTKYQIIQRLVNIKNGSATNWSVVISN